MIASLRLSRGPWLAALVITTFIAIWGNRYGFHRDELYFIEGGRHLDVAQPDNPILVPLLATAWHDLVGGQLWAFRLLPAVAAGLIMIIGALTARELGGTPRHQTAAAAATGLTSIVLATGHLFSITTFDILFTSATLWLLIRALKADSDSGMRGPGPWLAVGVVAGIALEIKVLPAVVLFSCLLGILLVGPRASLGRVGPWLAAVIAGVLASPNLIWQALHGWPMLEIARSIAAGNSVSSAARSETIYLHLLMAGPLLAIVLIIGLMTLIRQRHRRPYEWLAIAYLIFLVIVVAATGKPYYLAGFFPAVLAAGVIPVLNWIDRHRWRQVSATGLMIIFSGTTAVFSLPIAPVGSAPFQAAMAVNPDTGETVGWEEFIATVRSTANDIPAEQRNSSVILARNYAEAGALTRARRMDPADAELLPPVFSGHNAFAEWGPPPEAATGAIVVGDFSDDELTRWFSSCRQAAQFSSPEGVDNEEDGALIRVCTQHLQPWVDLWPQITRLS